MSSMMIDVVLDTETTTQNPNSTGLIQLSGIVLKNGTEIDRFNFKMSPFPEDPVSEETMVFHGIGTQWQEIYSYEDPREVYRKFIGILKRSGISQFDKYNKAWFLAYNAKFDDQVIRDWFAKCLGTNKTYFGSWFWYPYIDIMQLAALYFKRSRGLLRKTGELTNFKLEEVASALGVDVDKTRTHDAMYDTELALEVYSILKSKTQFTRDLDLNDLSVCPTCMKPFEQTTEELT